MLVTDESGDDGADVEEARQALKKYKVPSMSSADSRSSAIHLLTTDISTP